MKLRGIAKPVMWLAVAWFLLFGADAARAGPVTCAGSFTSLAFGNVNPASSQTDATATLSYTCTNTGTSDHYIAACFRIGIGPVDLANADPRRMLAGSGQYLQFQIYQDAARTTAWGSSSGTAGDELYVQVLAPANGSAPGTATVYGRVLPGQLTAVPGSYSEVLSSNALNVVDGGSKFPKDCKGGSTSGSSLGSLTVNATVTNPCTITANTLSFGTTGLLTAATTTTSTIAVQCPNTTPYAIGLDAGLNGGGNVNARTMSLATDSIGYQLYSDSGRSTVWGNTVGTNTVAGTGNGSTQNWTVYGKVPTQTTPTPGNYSDTVTVYVYY